ncbi:hypothetical protein M9Y10_004192 [Tritrichomonas musculus]|uniref:Uncharacterized protein n=1 Tax=Tritrichomonas musculus TaxID=1915356 RepID=A0ABR2JRE6_9EUKA
MSKKGNEKLPGNLFKTQYSVRPAAVRSKHRPKPADHKKQEDPFDQFWKNILKYEDADEFWKEDVESEVKKELRSETRATLEKISNESKKDDDDS